MKLTNYLKASLASMLLLSSTLTYADLIISPNDRIYVDRPQYVSCQDSYNPYPPPLPPRPPQEYVEFVDVRPDRRCLSSIRPTDGKSLSNEAYRCDINSPDSYRLRGGNCTLVRMNVDHRLAEEIISRATTVIHSNQKETIRTAAAHKVYECRFVR